MENNTTNDEPYEKTFVKMLIKNYDKFSFLLHYLFNNFFSLFLHNGGLVSSFVFKIKRKNIY